MKKQKLTPRQKVIFELYKSGLTQEQIAKRLKTYQGTITHDVELIKKKGYQDEIESYKFRNYERTNKISRDKWIKLAEEFGIEL